MMKEFVSIQSKLNLYFGGIIVAIFALVLIVVFMVNYSSVNENVRKTQEMIHKSLITKGKTLINNNSMALRGMAEDNAFTAIVDLVKSTVDDDEDIDYGIFMETERKPWAIVTPENPNGMPASMDPMEDSMSVWAASAQDVQFKEILVRKDPKGKPELMIEFVAPVSNDDGPLGYIRYGYSTAAMNKSIHEAKAAGFKVMVQMAVILLVLTFVSLGGGIVVVRRISGRFTKPIGSLVGSAQTIANGNYNIPVQSETNDEIGNLAKHFESMRATIKRYTDHLQDLVDEKMQQVNDILNNIDQGLFTINLDGTVNKEYSARANEILKVEDIALCTIQEIFRLDQKEEGAFNTWLELVQKKHDSQRWKKLARLAPVCELELMSAREDSQMEYISIDYQKIYDKNGRLSKLMVLARDETETRLRDIQMREQRLRHENEVKMILGIANTPPDEIAEFMEDTTTRAKNIKEAVQFHLWAVNKQRQEHPTGKEYVIAEDALNALYRDIHTIKGNGGSYGFEVLSAIAHTMEDQLEQLRQPTERRSNTLEAMDQQLNKLEEELAEIRKRITLILGKDEEVTIRIPEQRVHEIVQHCESLEGRVKDQEVATLIQDCKMLTWKPLKTLTRKYQKIVQRTARKLNKNVRFVVEPELQWLPAHTLADVDDVLTHMIRNAIDHGIETPEVRQELGKTIGTIRVRFDQKEDGTRMLWISDDGKGIDKEELVRAGIKKGIISFQEAEKLDEEGKLNLLYRPGLSTAEAVSDISGRGVGMDVVNEKVRVLGGRIVIDSTVGAGTTFTITLPPATAATPALSQA